MKKFIISAFAAMLTLVSCMEEMAAPDAESAEIYAGIEQKDATKTALDPSNNTCWSEGDMITAFMKTSLGLKYRLKDAYIGKTYGYFSKVSSTSDDDLGAGMEWEHNVAYYPYGDEISCSRSGNEYHLDIELPADQTYVCESFGCGAFPMIAVSEDNDITFRNVCGGIKLLLKGTQAVASVKIEGHGEERLAGRAVVTGYADGAAPAIELSDNAATSVTLTCAEAVQLNESTATEFIIALPPVTFSKGFTVTVTDTEDQTYEIATDKSNTVQRSNLLVMPAVSIGSGNGAVAPFIEMGPINTKGRFGVQWWGKQYYRTPHYYKVLDGEISVKASIDCDVRISMYDRSFHFIKHIDFSSLTSFQEKDFKLNASCVYVRLFFRKNSSIPEFELPQAWVRNISEEKYFEVRSDDEGYQRLVIPISAPSSSGNGVLPDYGMLVLPETYSNTGEPTRLIIYCHGAGTNYSSSITRFPTSALQPEYWLKEGYAVMDIEGNPFDNTNEHFYIPQAKEMYELAYNWVVNTYNICKDGVFLGGRSMGGGMCFDLLQSDIPILAACPLVPCTNTLWLWSYMNADRKKFCTEKMGFSGTAPSWTSGKTLSKEEIQYLYDNFDVLYEYSPFWKGIENLPDKDELFRVGNISADKKYDEAENELFSSLKFKVKAPVKLFGCPEDNVVPSKRNSELMYQMLKNAGQDCEIALYNSSISTPHHFELQDSNYMDDFMTSSGESVKTSLIYVEMLKYWQRYEPVRGE